MSRTFTAIRFFPEKTAVFPVEETLLLYNHRDVPTASSPYITLPRSKGNTFDILEVVFTTTGDLIKVHSYRDRCSATWEAATISGRLESERGDGTGVALSPEELLWVDNIRSLASEWLAAAEADDRSWLTRAATRIQRFDDRSDGLIDLVVVWPPERRRWAK
jgi:hypothetical protein